MAGEISSTDMQNFAIGSLDLNWAVVTSIADSTNRDQKMMNYNLLQIWRNKRAENSREVMFQSGYLVNPESFVSILTQRFLCLIHLPLAFIVSVLV